MITEKDLIEEINYCQTQPLTDKKFDRLASCFVVYDHLFGEPQNNGYSEDMNKVEKPTEIINTNSDTEFLSAVNGKNTEKVFQVLEELMQVTLTLYPKVYYRVIEKLNNI